MIGVYRAESRKLLAQVPIRVLVFACLLGPAAFGVVLKVQGGLPSDALLGTWVHSSGYALPFVVLGFAYTGFALIAGVLAGDLFSAEDRYGTWSTVLTRSCSRFELFAGKIAAVGVLALALAALTWLSSLAGGLLLVGDQPLVGLGGVAFSSGEGLWLVLVSWLLMIPPLLAFTSLAVLFSVATRNGIMGVLGPVLVALAMQLLALIGNGTWVHSLLVGSSFDAWHGLLATPRFYGPMIIGLLVCVPWIAGSLGAAWLILRRRDFTGPPVSRRAGWGRLAGAVLTLIVLLGLLGAATNLGSGSVTRSRLEASLGKNFERLTLLQQRELGRTIPKGARLFLRTRCIRHGGRIQGPGDDWSCTITVLTPQPGAEPFTRSEVTYDVGAKSNGCYKATSPSPLVGQQMMVDVHRSTVVNPLFTIYGCFDTTGPANPCAGSDVCAAGNRSVSFPLSTEPTKKRTTKAAPTKAASEAEREAGGSVVNEINQAEKELEEGKAPKAGEGR